MRVEVVLVWLACECWCERRHRDVRTAQGLVRGYLAPTAPAAAPHYAYLGIPYASPPINNYAFKAPRPPPRWDSIYEATHVLRCAQTGRGGVADCLALNVFAPVGRALPVLVLVHAGDFRTGSGETKAPDALIKKGIIVVSLNYRLGALGFLCLDSPSITGNAGAKDVLFALYWVHKNIERFGGDKYRVTAYGIGSGAAIVEMLLLSGMTEGLIHQAILESGTILSPTSLTHDPVSLAYDAALSAGYTGNKTTADLVAFYRSADLSQLLQMSASYTFLPCVENAHTQNSILERDPLDILQSRNFHKVPIMVSFTEESSAALSSNILESLPDHFEDLLPNNLAINNEEMKHKVAQLTKEFYFEDYVRDNEFTKPLGNYINDVKVEYPIIKSSWLHATRSIKPVYLMKLLKEGITKDGEEDTVFQYFYSKNNVKTDTEILSVMWSNFIKVGDPTPITTSLIATIWLPVYNTEDSLGATLSTAHMLYVGGGMKMGLPTTALQLAFWDNIYNNFYNYNHTIPNGT